MTETAAISPQRKWAAIGVGTFILLVSYWMTLLTLSAPLEDSEEVPEATGALALAMLLVPVAFFAVAAISQRPHRWWGTLAATGMGVAAGVLAAIVARDLATANVAGFAMGGAVALHPDRRGWLARRGLAVIAVALYVAVVVRITPLLAILMAPLLPLAAIGVADLVAERREARRAAAESS